MKNMFVDKGVKSIVIGFMLAGITSVHAEDKINYFKLQVESVLSKHHLAKMVDADLASAEEQVGVQRAAYFPTLSLSASAGKQDIERDSGTDGTYDPNEISVSINQLIYDFGTTSANMEAAKSVVAKEKLENDLQRQNLILAAVEAHLELLRAYKVEEYAQKSKENIQNQTKQESARVEAGKGYATDVLQAKAQLAAAEARSVVSSSSVNIAENRYRAVFGEQPNKKVVLNYLSVPASLLPESLEEVEKEVLLVNPDVVAAKARTQVAKSNLRQTKNSGYMPRLDIDLTHSQYHDKDGTNGYREDATAYINLEWEFNAGFKVAYEVDSAAATLLSETERTDYTIVQSLEEARGTWNSWNTSRLRTSYLQNQVEISKKFLSLARKERDLGRRSLLDILNAETALINAQSAAEEAQINELLAAFRLLRTTGRLQVSVFDNQ